MWKKKSRAGFRNGFWTHLLPDFVPGVENIFSKESRGDFLHAAKLFAVNCLEKRLIKIRTNYGYFLRNLYLKRVFVWFKRWNACFQAPQARLNVKILKFTYFLKIFQRGKKYSVFQFIYFPICSCQTTTKMFLEVLGAVHKLRYQEGGNLLF